MRTLLGWTLSFGVFLVSASQTTGPEVRRPGFKRSPSSVSPACRALPLPGLAQTAQPTWIHTQPRPTQNAIPLSVMPFQRKLPPRHHAQKLPLAPSVHPSPDASVKIPTPLHFPGKPSLSPKAMEEGPLPWGSDWTVVIGLFLCPPPRDCELLEQPYAFLKPWAWHVVGV